MKKTLKRLLLLKKDWLFIIYKTKWRYIFFILITNFLIGRIILFYFPFKNGLIHQIVLSIINILDIYALKFAYKKTEEIKLISAGINIQQNGINSYSISSSVSKMKNMQKSIWWLFAASLCGVIFAKKNLYMEFVPRNISGYYAILFGSITFAIALLGYAQIIISLIVFYEIADNKGNCIPVFLPDDLLFPPKWLLLWVDLLRRIEILFFIVGMLFTVEYLLLMPAGIVTFSNNKIALHTRYKLQVLSGWGVIIFFIIVAMPCISIIIRTFMKKILKNITKKVLHEYRVVSNEVNEKNILEYKKNITENFLLGKYIFESINPIPAITTIISILLNILKLYEGAENFFLNN